MDAHECYASLQVRIARMPHYHACAGRDHVPAHRLLGCTGTVEDRSVAGTVWLRLEPGSPASEVFVPAECLERAEPAQAPKPQPARS